jgi:hypothetical protein
MSEANIRGGKDNSRLHTRVILIVGTPIDIYDFNLGTHGIGAKQNHKLLQV